MIRSKRCVTIKIGKYVRCTVLFVLIDDEQVLGNCIHDSSNTVFQELEPKNAIILTFKGHLGPTHVRRERKEKYLRTLSSLSRKIKKCVPTSHQ